MHENCSLNESDIATPVCRELDFVTFYYLCPFFSYCLQTLGLSSFYSDSIYVVIPSIPLTGKFSFSSETV
jgi:hypothetical protein